MLGNTRAPKAFGANPKTLLLGGKWSEDVFGLLIVLRYDQQGNLSAHVYNEAITSEDVRHPPPVDLERFNSGGRRLLRASPPHH
jgi:hypothetical protein